MRRISARLAALEKFAGNDEVIAFMLDGASDDDVIAIEQGEGRIERQSGETLAELVERAQSLGNRWPTMLSFLYSDACKMRLGVHSEDANALPNTWPVPAPDGHACHVEHRHDA